MRDADRTIFMLPGPVKMDPRVLEAMVTPAMNHRGPEFKAILHELRGLVQYLFETDGKVAILSGSGTAGLEAAVAGLLRKGDRVLNLVNGKFSERFQELTQVFATSETLAVEWGSAVSADRVGDALDGGNFRAVTLCWNETSTGLTNPIGDIAKAVRKRDVYFLVDGITAVGGLECRMRDWGIDALVMGSQKCVAAPPGVSAVAISDRAYEALHTETSFYTNLKAHVDGLEQADTPYTPAVPLFLAFREALIQLKGEGLPARVERTRRLAEATRAAADALGLRLFPEPAFASNTVTAIRYPAGVDDSAFRRRLREEHRTIVAGGQGPLKGRIFRIGHMGICTFDDVAGCMGAIEATLAASGHRVTRGTAAEVVRSHSGPP